MDSQARQVDPGDTLQAYLRTLQEEFRRSLAESLRRSGYLEQVEQDQHDLAVSQAAVFKFVVDGSRRCSPNSPM
ncbi:hypothetical protein U5801_22270 [Lamprobacter modestohalophilus]|uniref:hypothetical protein n=1 Tax=Lamprobacter modestohalophilus TaxID=1064514 RepID=UPI002ADEC0DD|nr:hypothetical protein [Lamprobacter modestohalophilus]MEA1052510.1 hypothetical protein [Lamprobacter modestohalophilus]